MRDQTKQQMKRILLIEDEKNMSRFIELELRHEGFEVAVAADGTSGMKLSRQGAWDLVLLDLMLPGVDGLEICRELRKSKRTPVLMITARDSVRDRVSGLDSGADDYLPKPFAIEELLARIRVIFRRQEDQVADSRSILIAGDLQLDLDRYTLHRADKLISLTKREFSLLHAFMMQPGRVLSREQLLDSVWGFAAVVDTNVVDVYVRYLRNKIDVSGKPSCIQSVRGIGYIMQQG